MKIIISPDSFKGSATSMEVAYYLEQGIRTVLPEAEIFKFPLADGGEGTLEAILATTSGKRYTQKVAGPDGRPLEATYGILQDGTAVIEMAQASGLTLVPESHRDALHATSYGTGQLIKAALEQGCNNFLLGLGGSATTDGGAAILQALGARLLNRDGADLPCGGLALQELNCIDLRNFDARLARCRFQVMCDVDNPLCGSNGAAAVYGPQKGATPQQVIQLDEALRHYAMIIKATFAKDILEIPGAGAAGGIGGCLLAFFHAQLLSGVKLLLQRNGFEQALPNADLVITGEGRIDRSTAYGKAPVGISQLAKKYHLPVVAVAGCLGPGSETVLDMGIDWLLPLANPPLPTAESMARVAELLITCGQSIARHYQTKEICQ